MLTRHAGLKLNEHERYETRFVPETEPVTLLALLYTIVIMFSLREATS